MYESLRNKIAELESIYHRHKDYELEIEIRELKDELRWLEMQDYLEFENPDYYRAY